jgi:hypothetical protein
MERGDPEQEGQTLPPIWNLRPIIREETERMILQHIDLCPFSRQNIEGRLRTQEQRFFALLGFMAGAGFFGGLAGGAVLKLLGG